MFITRLLFILIVSFSSVLNAASLKLETISKSEFILHQSDSRISIKIAKPLLHKKDILLEWLQYSIATVTQYYDQFPVTKLHIRLESTNGNKVTFGQAFSGEMPFVRVVVGNQVTAESLKKDWVLVHEMVHLAMAHIARKHLWLLEGLATYVESLARAQNNDISEKFVWKGFLKRMHQGLPKVNDKGLDFTPTWGRTYWGGALFCLLADIDIRKQTNNQYSLQDALKGVLAKGLSMQASSTPEEIFKTADSTVGVLVLMPLYDKMKASPYPVDLNALWTSLGVSLKDGDIRYDQSAPLSFIREKLLK